MTRARRAAVVLGCALALFVGTGARAHSGHPILRAERTIKFEADGHEGLRVVLTVNYGAEQMLRIARRADENGNGIVEAGEVEAFMHDWSNELRRQLPLRMDGSFARVTYGRTFFDPKGAIALAPGTLEIVAELLVPAGRHSIFLTDEMASDEFDRTDVMFEVTNGATLHASGPTEAPLEVVPSFAYGRSTEVRRVRAIGMVFDMPQPPGGSLPKPRALGLTLPLGVILIPTVFAVILGRLLRAIRERDADQRRRVSA